MTQSRNNPVENQSHECDPLDTAHERYIRWIFDLEDPNERKRPKIEAVVYQAPR